MPHRLGGKQGWILSQLLWLKVPGLLPISGLSEPQFLIYGMRPWNLIRVFQLFSVEAHLEPMQGIKQR